MRFFDMEGHPVSHGEWMKAFSDEKGRTVALTTGPGGERLSTVWVGIDASWSHERPRIFESLYFPTGRIWRWASLEEARAGHARLAAELEAAGWPKERGE